MLAATTVVSVQALGSVHTWALVAVAVLAFTGAVLAARESRKRSGRITFDGPTILCAALAAYTLLQAAPAPRHWIDLLAPANADVWSRATLTPGETPGRWASLSLDPGASAVEALKLAVYAAVFFSARGLAASSGPARGITFVFASGLALAVTTVAHGLAGATAVWGFYTPSFTAAPWHLGPLLNVNNLAGYLNLSVLCGFGLLLSHQPPLPRWLVAVGIAFMVAVGVTSASRAGLLLLPIGIVSLLGVLQRRGERPSVAFWLALAAVGGGLALAVLGGTAETWTELYDKNVTKLGMFLWVRPMLADHGRFGIGRGAFESVFPAYRVGVENHIFTHAENFPAQWVAEWGVPIGGAALAAFAWVCRPRGLGGLKSKVALAGYVGVMVLVAQNLLDLALEVPGVCVAVAVVLGSAAGSKREGRATLPNFRWSGGVPAALALAGLGLLSLLSAALFGRVDVADDRTAMREQFGRVRWGSPEDVESLRAGIRKAAHRHPADPYFPLLGATAAWRARDQDPMPWLQRALERGQTSGRTHLLLAEVLASRKAVKQALFELRLATQFDSTLVGVAARLAVGWTSVPELLVMAAPGGREGVPILDAMAEFMPEPDRLASRERIDALVLERDPRCVGAHRRAAEALITVIAAPHDGMCMDLDACRASAESHATAIQDAEPLRSQGVRLRAQILRALGRSADAERLLAEACSAVTDRVVCLQARAGAAAEAKAFPRLGETSKELLSEACASADECANMETWIADLWASRNEWAVAVPLYERAARENPTDERWMKVADAAARLGSHAQAADALERIARRHGGEDAALRARIRAEKERAASGLIVPGATR